MTEWVLFSFVGNFKVYNLQSGMWQNASWAVRYLRREKFKVGIFNSMFFRCLIKVEINLLDQKEGITLQMLCVCSWGGAIQSQILKVTLSAFYTFLQLHFTFKGKTLLTFTYLRRVQGQMGYSVNQSRLSCEVSVALDTQWTLFC